MHESWGGDRGTRTSKDKGQGQGHLPGAPDLLSLSLELPRGNSKDKDNRASKDRYIYKMSRGDPVQVEVVYGEIIFSRANHEGVPTPVGCRASSEKNCSWCSSAGLPSCPPEDHAVYFVVVVVTT